MSEYNFELKLKIVRENWQGYGSSYLTKKYNLNKDTIKTWIRQYKMYGEDGLKNSMSKTGYSGEFKLYVL